MLLAKMAPALSPVNNVDEFEFDEFAATQTWT